MYDKKNNFLLLLSCFVLIITFLLNYATTFNPPKPPLSGRNATPTPIPDKRLALEIESNIGYVRSVVRDNTNFYLSFDPIIYRADDEARRDYELLCSDAPPGQCPIQDGYLIRRNLTSKTKTFSVAPDIVLIIGSQLAKFDDWQQIFTTDQNSTLRAQYSRTPFRIETNSRGEAVLLFEVYQP